MSESLERNLHKSPTTKSVGAWYDGIVPLDIVLTRMVQDIPQDIADNTSHYTSITVLRKKDAGGEGFTSWKVTYDTDS